MTNTSRIRIPAANAYCTGCDQTGMPATRIVRVRQPPTAAENRRMLIKARETHAAADGSRSFDPKFRAEPKAIHRFKSP